MEITLQKNIDNDTFVQFLKKSHFTFDFDNVKTLDDGILVPRLCYPGIKIMVSLKDQVKVVLFSCGYPPTKSNLRLFVKLVQVQV